MTLTRVPDQIGPARTMPGGPSRLVLAEAGEPGWGLESERNLGYFQRPHSPYEVISTLEEAGLRGRGGAGFPTHVKWRSVAAAADAGQVTVVVANGHEGEPASAKDRWLLTHRPHLVLDGLLLAAEAVDAARVIVYVSHPDAIAAVRSAIADLVAADLVPGLLTIEVFESGHAYVAGEESAVCRAINGGPALPLAKPPRPFESGVEDLPTLINNVETLAHVAWINRHGAAAFREVGTATSPGSTLFTMSGAGVAGAVVEAPLGTRVADLVQAAGGDVQLIGGLLMGGWFGGVLTDNVADLNCCYEGIKAAGSGLGCAAITVLGHDEDLVATAAELAGWFAAESARQCGVCKNGTKAIHSTLNKVVAGDSDPEHSDNLARWGQSLTGRGACAFLDGAATLARSVTLELTERRSQRDGQLLTEGRN